MLSPLLALGQPLFAYLAAGALLFCGGLFLVLTRRNTVVMLMGVELMLNAGNLTFIAFASLHGHLASGSAAVLIVMVVAAGQAAVALGLVLAVYDRFSTADASLVNQLKK